MTAPSKSAPTYGHACAPLGAHDVRREVNPCQVNPMQLTCRHAVGWLATWTYDGKRRGHTGLRPVQAKKTLCDEHARAWCARYDIPFPGDQ